MNTYNIEYNGITVLERIPEYALKKHLEMAKGFLYLQGSITLKDIEQGLSVSLNMWNRAIALSGLLCYNSIVT